MRRTMEDWEWEAWSERHERIERVLCRTFVILGFAALILANAYSLWLLGSAVRNWHTTTDGLLEHFITSGR